MIFTPNLEYVKAATRLCICENCKLDYGSCPLFKSYELQVDLLNELQFSLLKEPVLRFDNIEVSSTIKPGSSEYFLPGLFLLLQQSPSEVILYGSSKLLTNVFLKTTL